MLGRRARPSACGARCARAAAAVGLRFRATSIARSMRRRHTACSCASCSPIRIRGWPCCASRPATRVARLQRAQQLHIDVIPDSDHTFSHYRRASSCWELARPPRARDHAAVNRNAHLPALDGLRGLAILLVIPHNANLYGEHPGFFWPLAMLANAGWIGCAAVLRAVRLPDHQRAAADAVRTALLPQLLRAARTAHHAAVLRRAAGRTAGRPGADRPAAAHGRRARSGVPWLWLFLSNWVQPFGLAVPGFSHFWSLAVEEQFYLLWPLAIVALTDRGIARLCGALMPARRRRPRLLLPAFGAPAGGQLRADGLPHGRARRRRAGGAAAARTGRADLARRARHAARHGRIGSPARPARWLTRLYDRHDWRTLGFGEPLLALAFAALILAAATPRPGSGAGSVRWPGRRCAPSAATAIGMYVLHLPIVLAIMSPSQRLAGRGRTRRPAAVRAAGHPAVRRRRMAQLTCCSSAAVSH